VLAPAPDKLDTLVTVRPGPALPDSPSQCGFEAIGSDTPSTSGLAQGAVDWLTWLHRGQVSYALTRPTRITSNRPAAFGITPPATLSVARYDQSVALLEASAAPTTVWKLN